MNTLQVACYTVQTGSRASCSLGVRDVHFEDEVGRDGEQLGVVAVCLQHQWKHLEPPLSALPAEPLAHLS